jgi:uncharacterized protein YndB with AHSA1/START domain
MIDTIEREVLIAAPIERVWDVITRPEHVGRWFGDAGAEQHGDVIRVRWEEAEAELRIVRSERPHAFAWRWDAHVAGIGDTLVEFTLASEGDATRVHVIESGFASLAATDGVREEAREGNVRGWKNELGHLQHYAETVAV